MRKFWFFEGFECTGKTTVVREIQRLSRYHVNGVNDRGPLSRLVWGRFMEEPESTWIHWREWFREARHVVAVMYLSDDVDIVARRLASEMEAEGYEGYDWTLPEILLQLRLYTEEVHNVAKAGVEVKCYDFNAARTVTETEDEAYDLSRRIIVRMMGYTPSVLDAGTSGYRLGDRDESTP